MDYWREHANENGKPRCYKKKRLINQINLKMMCGGKNKTNAIESRTKIRSQKSCVSLTITIRSLLQRKFYFTVTRSQTYSANPDENRYQCVPCAA